MFYLELVQIRNMSKESLYKADSIIMDAYKNGLSIMSAEDNTK